MKPHKQNNVQKINAYSINLTHLSILSFKAFSNCNCTFIPVQFSGVVRFGKHSSLFESENKNVFSYPDSFDAPALCYFAYLCYFTRWVKQNANGLTEILQSKGITFNICETRTTQVTQKNVENYLDLI